MMCEFETKDLLKIVENCFGILCEEVELTSKYMFGGALCYTFGRPFISITSFGIAVKLPTDRLAELLTIKGARHLQLSPTSAPNKNYILVPIDWHEDFEKLLPIFMEASVHCRTLKLPKKRNKKA
ncbi:MAG: hypothetical protein OCD03_06630 [Hyphomicrobiales bacterium]